jgi:hypothetical protein
VRQHFSRHPNTAAAQNVRPGKKETARGIDNPQWVTLGKLYADIDRGFRYFCRRRPHFTPTIGLVL